MQKTRTLVAGALLVACLAATGCDNTQYQNCDAAESAGAAPIKSRDPGYRSGLDRDGDGVACDAE